MVEEMEEMEGRRKGEQKPIAGFGLLLLRRPKKRMGSTHLTAPWLVHPLVHHWKSGIHSKEFRSIG